MGLMGATFVGEVASQLRRREEDVETGFGRGADEVRRGPLVERVETGQICDTDN